MDNPIKKFLSEKVINYLLEVLFLTDLWYLVYVFILDFLNKTFPFVSKITFLGNLGKTSVSPEPFEIPLYLILTGIFVLVIFVFHKFLRKKIEKFLSSYPKLIYFKVAAIIILLAIFISHLGPYPNPIPVVGQSTGPVAYLFQIAIITILMPTLDYIYTNSKAVFRYLIYVFIAGVIAVFTYIPTFPVSFYDYSFFLGPVYEIANGKTIFTQIQAQYGFLTILLFSLLQKLSIFNIFYLPVIIWFLYIIEYLVAFYLIFKISKSVVFSVIGLFSIITVGFFSPIFYPYTYPQVSPLRWLPMVLFLLLFYKFKNPVSKVLIFLTALISLFMIDSGIAIVLAYLFSLSILFLKKQMSFSKVIISTFYLLISVIGIYLFIDFFSLLLGFKNINIFYYFQTIELYAHEGFGMIKIGNFSYFWLVVLVYLASIVYFIRKKNIDHLDMLLLFSANLAFFGADYFVGRSHPNNLFHISILFLINFFILAGIAYKNIKQTWFKSILLMTLFFFFIVFPAYSRQSQIAFLFNAKSVSSDLFSSSLSSSAIVFNNEKNLIKTYLKDNKVIVLSFYDTYFFYLSGKQNLLRVNPQSSLNTREELVASVEDAVKVCPKTIAVDCSIYGKCPKIITPDGTGAMRQEELLKEIQNRCGFTTYKLLKCTNYLCIVKNN